MRFGEVILMSVYHKKFKIELHYTLPNLIEFHVQYAAKKCKTFFVNYLINNAGLLKLYIIIAYQGSAFVWCT